MVLLELICANKKCENPRRYELDPTDFNKNRKRCQQCDRKAAIIDRREKWETFRDLMDDYLGTECTVCGTSDDLRAHEKFGKPHKKLMDSKLKEVEENCKSGRFVRVCEKCHRKSHALIDDGIVDWETVKDNIQTFYDTNPPKEDTAHRRAWQKFRRFIKNEGQYELDGLFMAS
jgi:hypothetical protein